MNIVLIGMPGCGKSTVGVVLAKALGYTFLDTDILIQKMQGRLLQDIIDNSGDSEFFECENKALLSVDCDNTVIATGGSAVFSQQGMEHLKKNAKVVYIKLSCDVIRSRLKNLSTRGVVGAKNKSIKEIFDERTPLYEKYADIVVNNEDCDITETVEQIKKTVF